MNPVLQIISGLMNNPCPPQGRWVKHNCPVCHDGSSGRIRGSYLFEGDGFAWHCFNCQHKASWKAGMVCSNKFLEFMEKLGASTNDLMQLQLISRELADSGDYVIEERTNASIYQKITQRHMPDNAKPFSYWAEQPQVPQQFLKVLESVFTRNRYLLNLDLWWCPDSENDMYRRFIIPYKMNSEIVGYTARDTHQYSKLRYLNQVSTNTFYNFDLLNDPNIKTLFVAEGVLDAALLGALGLGKFEISDVQVQQLKAAQERGKRVVIVPDRDKDGRKTIEQAIDCGFDVAFPEWGTKRTANGVQYIKDFEEASTIMGRLFCTVLVHNSIANSEFETRVLMNKWI